jgi:hypothetical protein
MRRECKDELVVCHLGNLIHLGARRPPGVVGGGIANLRLDVRVALCVVFGHAEGTLAKVLYGHDGSGRVRDWWLSFSVQSKPSDPRAAQLITHKGTSPCPHAALGVCR